MRHRVPATEVVIGGFILFLLAGIVAAALVVAVRPQAPLFAVRPGLERKATLSREERMAQQMMPSFGTAGWSAPEIPQILDRAALAADGAGNWLNAGAVWVYRGTYSCAATGESVSVTIVDAQTPTHASNLYERRRPHDAIPLAVGNEGWRTEQNGAFWAGRYYTEFDRSAVRSPEPSVRTITDALGSVQVAYGSPPWEGEAPAEPLRSAAVPAASTQPQTSPFPAIDLPDWEAPTEFRVYTPLNLWEKIDGRAEIYLQFDMQRMTFGAYRQRSNPAQALDVYWYEMAAPEGAFGIYQAESGGRIGKADVGDEGHVSGGGVVFRKGSHYGLVQPTGEGTGLEAASLAIARAMAARIPGTGTTPWADQVLPREGRTGAGLAYHGTDAFSLDFLNDVFSADYSADGQTFIVFVHRASDPAEAARLLEAYEAFFKDNGRVLEQGRSDGIEFLVGESGGLVDAAFAVDVYLGGVNNCAEAAFAKERALAFARSLSTAGPKE